jgi:hypothetical protein
MKNGFGKCHLRGTGDVYIGFWWRKEVKRLLERPKTKWEDNIKIDWTGLPQTRKKWRVFISTVMNFLYP